ncbi:MAG: T4 RnlA family RNA ligase [Bacteroidales bacterium]|jgi:hypothetical protein|nr:T4 RnlA family RNA ligase [Bacteroidales bacterium]
MEKHPRADLYIYGYYATTKNHVWDNISEQCRGLILDKDGNVVAKPFQKFWTFQQYLSDTTLLLNDNQIVEIPKCQFKILEKIDGTMATLYWIKDIPYLATQRSFTNPKAIVATRLLHEKYSHLFSSLNKKYTYIFEVVYPETKVIVDYKDKKDLYLIGLIENETGQNLSLTQTGFPTCMDYTNDFKHLKNFNDIAQLNVENQERRIEVKTSLY